MDPQAQAEEKLPLLVCALIVSHNCAPALRECIAALEASKGREQIEILVVDNGSRDGSRSIDSEFPGVTMLRLPHFCGMTKARNIGIRTARAEYLLLLSPDVIVEPATVMDLHAQLERDSATTLAVCPSLNGAGRMRKLPDAAAVGAACYNPDALPSVTDPAQFELHDGKAILVRKNTIQGMNYLDERFGEHWGDVEVAFQIKRAGKRIVMAEKARAKLLPDAGLWRPSSPSDRAAFAADSANGAAAYLSKHFGFGASLGLRLKLILGALLRTLSFQDPGYNASLLNRLLSGYKIDGTSQNL
jgi:glycosyltransferase involved in cell wall biosynthesis